MLSVLSKIKTEIQLDQKKNEKYNFSFIEEWRGFEFVTLCLVEELLWAPVSQLWLRTRVQMMKKNNFYLKGGTKLLDDPS